MAKTRAELIERALTELRLSTEAEPASDYNTAQATKAIDPLIARLRQDRVYNVRNGQSFDDFAFENLAMLLVEDIGYLAGKAKQMAAVEYHEGKLRNMQKQPLDRNELYVDAALRRREYESFDGT